MHRRQEIVRAIFLPLGSNKRHHGRKAGADKADICFDVGPKVDRSDAP